LFKGSPADDNALFLSRLSKQSEDPDPRGRSEAKTYPPLEDPYPRGRSVAKIYQSWADLPASGAVFQIHVGLSPSEDLSSQDQNHLIGVFLSGLSIHIP